MAMKAAQDSWPALRLLLPWPTSALAGAPRRAVVLGFCAAAGGLLRLADAVFWHCPASASGRLCCLVAVTALAALGSVAEGAPRAAGPGAPRLLLVNSCLPGSRWGIELTAGVRHGIGASFPQATVLVEHLAVDGVPAAEAGLRLAGRLEALHAQEPITLAIAADDAAFAFALAQGNRLLPGVPLVFCGVSDLPADTFARHPLVTGAVQVRDLSAVLATALNRHPETRALVTVHDVSPVGLAYGEQVQSWTDELLRRRPGMIVAFLRSDAYSTAELVEQVRVLPPECLVLLTSWSQDREGLPQRLDDVLARIARVSPVPVYGVTGSEGGLTASLASLRDAYRQGEAAAAIAVQILRGVPPSEIPVRVVRSVAELSADASLAEEESMGPPRLGAPPIPAAPISRPPRSLLLALGFCALAFHAVLAAMLFNAIRRRHQLHRALEESRHRLDQIVDCAALGVLEWDLRTDTIAVTGQCAERLGYAAAELGPSRGQWEALVHPDDLPAVRAAVADLLEDRATHYCLQYRMRTRAGTYRWVQECGDVVSRAADGAASRFLAVQTDALPTPSTTP